MWKRFLLKSRSNEAREIEIEDSLLKICTESSIHVDASIYRCINAGNSHLGEIKFCLPNQFIYDPILTSE